MTSRALKASCGLFLLTLGGCEAAKSSNPTAPTVAGPIAGVPISAPALAGQDGSTGGPVGGIAYEFQVAPDQAFSHLMAAGIVGEGSGTTTFNTGALSWATTYYWRVRASDGETTSSWTLVQAFRTPAAPAKPPPPGNPPPTGG